VESVHIIKIYFAMVKYYVNCGDFVFVRPINGCRWSIREINNIYFDRCWMSHPYRLKVIQPCNNVMVLIFLIHWKLAWLLYLNRS